MSIHRRYYGDAARPKEESKAESPEPDKAAHMLDALNKDLANTIRNERLKGSDKKKSTP